MVTDVQSDRIDTLWVPHCRSFLSSRTIVAPRHRRLLDKGKHAIVSSQRDRLTEDLDLKHGFFIGVLDDVMAGYLLADRHAVFVPFVEFAAAIAFVNAFQVEFALQYSFQIGGGLWHADITCVQIEDAVED